MDIKEIALLGDDAPSHWYYRSKAYAIERMLGDQRFDLLLDVGAGSGFFSRHLLAQSSLRASCCVDPNYEREWQEAVAGKPLNFLRGTAGIDADLVLLMDVLEHVDDDVGLLCEYRHKTPAEATFLISVPAFQWMWSAHDVFLGHRRRYTLNSLEASVRAAGLRVIRSCYFYGAIFPLALAVRAARRRHASGQRATSDLRRHSAPVNAALLALCRSELALMHLNRLFGLTVFCLARGPKAAEIVC